MSRCPVKEEKKQSDFCVIDHEDRASVWRAGCCCCFRRKQGRRDGIKLSKAVSCCFLLQKVLSNSLGEGVEKSDFCVFVAFY